MATYHYDIKRVNDQQSVERHTSGTGSSLQVKGPAASLDITHSSAASGVQAYKVFLVQVRSGQQSRVSLPNTTTC